jgi:hypothetical protein
MQQQQGSCHRCVGVTLAKLSCVQYVRWLCNVVVDIWQQAAGDADAAVPGHESLICFCNLVRCNMSCAFMARL